MVSRLSYKTIQGIGRVVLLIIIAAIVIAAAIAFPILKQKTDAKYAVQQAEQLIAKGNAALTEGEVEDAIFAYMRAVKICPRLPGVHLTLGKALMLDGRGDEAIDAVSKELEGGKESVEAHLLLGFLYLLKASGNDPLGAYVAREMPDAMGYPGMSGGKPAFKPTGDYPLTDALFHFKYAEGLAPHEIRAAIGLAVMNALQGDYLEAHSRFKELLQRVPDNTFIADALVRVPALSQMTASAGPAGLPSASPWLSPGFEEGDTLPPIDTDWVEVDPDSPVTDDRPTEPPDVSAEGAKELPLPHGATEPEYTNSNGPMVNSEGDLIITPGTFRHEPKTRPFGPIRYSHGTPPVPVVVVVNLFSNGQVKLTVGESDIVPNSGAQVKFLRVEGGNTVVLIEDGEEYTWVRGKVEWALKPENEEPEAAEAATGNGEDDGTTSDEDS